MSATTATGPDVVDRDEGRDDGPPGRGFWVGLAVGWAVIGYGVVLAIGDAEATNPPALARWVLGGLLVHDLIVAPVATLAVIGIRAWFRPPWRGPLTAALAMSALVVVFAYPLLRGFGERPTNPSALPGDYPAATAVVVASIWAVAAVVVLVRRRSRWR